MFVNNKFYFSLLCIALSLITLAEKVSAQPADPTSYGMTSGRLLASTAAVIGLFGVVIGGLAWLRPAGAFGIATGRLGAVLALAAGFVGLALGALAAGTSGGHIGTGGGLAGAIVAMVLGLIAMALGGAAIGRARRTP